MKKKNTELTYEKIVQMRDIFIQQDIPKDVIGYLYYEEKEKTPAGEPEL